MRRLLPATAAAIALGLALAASAVAHQGNPNMRSVLRSVHPATPSLSLRVLNGDDRFELTNRSREPVLLLGYTGEPYARVLPDGTVEQNTNSPAFYVNQERYGGVPVPASATATAPPTWKVLDRTGTFQWHDHRMHYMATGIPASVKDTKKRQKVFDYTIPIRIGARPGAIDGTLLWTPQEDSGPPVGAVAALTALVLAGAVAVVLTRRRRRRGRPDDDGPGTAPQPAAEAW